MQARRMTVVAALSLPALVFGGLVACEVKEPPPRDASMTAASSRAPKAVPPERLETAAQVVTGEKALAQEILSAAGVKGGLIVHVGCGNGKLTAALGASDGFLVQGLEADPKTVEEARRHIRSLGLYGKVSVDHWAGKRLPYVDNLVNLVVSVEPASQHAGATMEDLLRVLAPHGVAYVKRDGTWTKTVKPRPEEIDEWTHYLHDATGNAVAHDSVVGPPRRLQWVGSPKWARHHDHMASMSALVSAGERIFYIFDEGPTASIQLPAKWSLIARDAFNGVILWKRPIASWNTHRWPLKSGPAQLPRRLVAVGDEVYVTLGLDAPLTALDSGTGRTIRTYRGTEHTEEVIASDGTLFLVVHDAPSKWPEFRQRHSYVWDNTGRANREWAWDEQKRRIVAVEADTGKVLWAKEACVAPLTLSADRGSVFFHDGEKVVCLDRKSGEEIWRSEPVARRRPVPVCFGPTLVVYGDVVLFAGGTRSMTALDAATGKTLWTEKHHRGGHLSPEDLLVLPALGGGLAWSGAIANGKDSGVFTGRDLRTGEVKIEFEPDVKIYWFHHRCYRAKATDRFILPSRTGIEFVDFRKKHWETHHWVRGGCIYGIMPCNGLIYAPPHSCGCYLEAKLNGFNALAPASAAGRVRGGAAAVQSRNDGRLERGPAYGEAMAAPAASSRPDDWPTYRHDTGRSGRTKTAVPTDLKRIWQQDLGVPVRSTTLSGRRGRLSSVVIAGGRAFVASVDTHTVHALEAGSGKSVWSYTTGGRVDSPPTVYRGRVLFGSADGWVYCLRASDGALIWRFRAAPLDERLVAYEQLESVWPVHGSVLVQEGVLYCVAGRSMFLDGGLRFIRLDPETGRILSETILDDRDPESGKNLQVHVKGLNMPVALPDVLSSDGRYVYMRSQRFDLQGKRPSVAPMNVTEQEGEGAHLFCQIGFLDDSWFHRSYWLFGRSVAGGYGGWFRAARLVPSGRLLVFDDSSVYGYGRRPEYVCNASVLEYRLYAAEKGADTESIRRVRQAGGRMNARSRRRNGNSSDWKLRRAFSIRDLSAVEFKWSHDHPSVQARAMVLADRTLFVAGPPDVVDERRAFRLPDDEEIRTKLAEQAAALAGGAPAAGPKGGRLWAVSASDGEVLVRYQLDALPVFDGMAAANGRLFLATTDGKVLCLGADRGEPLVRVEDEPLAIISDEPPEPDYLEPPEVRKDEDFDHVEACVVLASKLGYRLRRKQEGRFGFALNRLKTPIKRKAVFEVKLRSIQAGGFLRNGFLAFGDGPEDAQLVRCGVRIYAKKALITQGTLKDGKTKSRDLAVDDSKLIDVAVAVDLGSQKVTLSVKGAAEAPVTVEAPVVVEATLTRRLNAITHVGYCIDGAFTDFSPVEIAGE